MYWEQFGRHMGTVWHRSTFDTQRSKQNHNPDVLFYPHALMVSPNNLYRQIKQDFDSNKPIIAGGEYTPERGEDVVELSDLSYDEFRDFYRTFESGLRGD